MRPLRRTLAVLALASSTPAFAAEVDWFNSLYTGEGVELRADERVFALFAVFNALGYDEAPLSRKLPVPERQFHPVREKVRARVLGEGTEIRKQADAFLDAHPVAMERYLAYTLSASGIGESAGKEAGELKGLESVLARAYADWKLADLLGAAHGEYRKALKGYLTALDGPMAKARKLLGPGEGPAPVVVMNLLEAQGEARGTLVAGAVAVSVGPSDKPNVEGVLREYARAVLGPRLAKRIQTGWPAGAALLTEANAAGAGEGTVGDLGVSMLARAIALRAIDAPDAAYEASAHAGYPGLREVAKGLDGAEGKPVEGWALETLGRVESRRRR